MELSRRIEVASSRLGVGSICRVRLRNVEICESVELTLHVSDGGRIAYAAAEPAPTRACAKAACAPEGADRLLELEDSLGRRVARARRVVEVCVLMADPYSGRPPE